MKRTSKKERPLSRIDRVEMNIIKWNKGKICEVCGGTYKTKFYQKYCSYKCRYHAEWSKVREKEKNNRVPVECRCLECNNKFTVEYGDTRKKYCSSRCANKYVSRISKARYDERLKEAWIEDINPMLVFERDKWKCKGCNKNTPRNKRGSYDLNAPELDHIIPLSIGGKHCYSNVQLLCRGCNMMKGNGVLIQGEQLNIIG